MKFKAYYLNPYERGGNEDDYFKFSLTFFDSATGDDELDSSYDLRHHTFVREVEAESLEDAFIKSQGEYWSPNGEARDLIIEKGLDHTSASVGDVLVDEEGNRYLIESYGFYKF